MNSRLTRSIAAAAVGAFATAVAHAGSFGVTPTRVDLEKGARSAIIEVVNDDAVKLSFQAKLFEWRQDGAGKDQYTESQDLIYFPQLFTVNPKDKRIIRLGAKGPAPAVEKSYRLFIEELQPPEVKPAAGAQVRVVLRFGVPVFVAPAAAVRKFELGPIELRPGKAHVAITSLGNQSARFEKLELRRGDQVLGEVAGWHVLAGSTWPFDIPVDRARCVADGTLEVVAVAEGITLKRAVDASPVLCERP